MSKSTNSLSPQQQLYEIVEHGMCIGCGICQSMADSNNVTMEIVDTLFERPIASLQLSEKNIQDIMTVCPGARVQAMPAELVSEQTQIDSVWGAWQEIYLAYSAEPEVRHQASTGGVLSGLALYLIEFEEVDFILHAKASSSQPTFGEATISRSRTDILAATGSRYGPTATLIDIVKVLDQAEFNNETFAFIGTPCDVSALRNYAELDSRVDQLCKYMLTMVCGGFMSPQGLKKFIQSRGIEFNQITGVRYRGYGCPGPTIITMADGSSHEISYLDFWGEDDSQWHLPPRCKICPDGIGESADIAAADNWNGGAPTVESSKSDLGSNATIVRTDRGTALMNQAIENGYLVRDQALSTDDLNRFQPHQETKKRFAWARLIGIQDAGNKIPDTVNLRLKELAKSNSDEENIMAKQGAHQRVLSGKFSEPTPRKLKPLN